MKWRAYRAEIWFHSEFYSCGEYLLIFAKEKICSGRSCGIKDQVRCRRFRELSGLVFMNSVAYSLQAVSRLSGNQLYYLAVAIHLDGVGFILL